MQFHNPKPTTKIDISTLPEAPQHTSNEDLDTHNKLIEDINKNLNNGDFLKVVKNIREILKFLEIRNLDKNQHYITLVTRAVEYSRNTNDKDNFSIAFKKFERLDLKYELSKEDKFLFKIAEADKDYFSELWLTAEKQYAEIYNLIKNPNHFLHRTLKTIAERHVNTCLKAINSYINKTDRNVEANDYHMADKNLSAAFDFAEKIRFDISPDKTVAHTSISWQQMILQQKILFKLGSNSMQSVRKLSKKIIDLNPKSCFGIYARLHLLNEKNPAENENKILAKEIIKDIKNLDYIITSKQFFNELTIITTTYLKEDLSIAKDFVDICQGLAPLVDNKDLMKLKFVFQSLKAEHAILHCKLDLASTTLDDINLGDPYIPNMLTTQLLLRKGLISHIKGVNMAYEYARNIEFKKEGRVEFADNIFHRIWHRYESVDIETYNLPIESREQLFNAAIFYEKTIQAIDGMLATSNLNDTQAKQLSMLRKEVKELLLNPLKKEKLPNFEFDLRFIL